MKYKKVFLILICTLFLTSCKPEDAPKKDEDYAFLVADEGEVTMPLTPFESLDPVSTTNMSYFYLCSLVYDGIYTLDTSYKPILALGESEQISGKTITIKLKDGVTFHDGSELNANDVVETLAHIKTVGIGVYADLIKNPIDGTFSLNCEKVNNKTIRFTWNGAGPLLKEYLIFPIVKYKNNGSEMPLGTGPFKFERYDVKKAIYLSRYNYYFGELPSITKITGVVHEDEDLIYTSLETGRVNVSTAWSNDYGRFYNNDKFSAEIFAGNKITFLFLNPNRTLNAKENRRAIFSLINRDELIKNALKDRGVATYSFINPKSYYKRPVNTNFDEEKVKNLLKEQKLKLSLYFYYNNETQIKVANQILRLLREYGVEVTTIPEYGDFETYKKNLAAGNYDMAIANMNINIIPTFSFDLNSGITFPYKDEVLTGINNIISECDNNSDFKKAITDADAYIYNESVFVPLFFNENAMIYKNNIIGEKASNNIYPYNTLRKAYFTEKEESENLEKDNNK
ncbi:MAG: ABC transporter substrate-binding protein [Ezakiella sp.]|nr:ABC transporter substrate-binding protein [Ezakiella sp.]MDD7471646.1 ABC transporter substrate-binding protein [Bacillota bacterium]MDY3923430.1 ABC transporter substrate-binding protein [Ezakiella sp.]